MMEIAYLKDHKNKKRGESEWMERADFLKLYGQEIATSKIDWDRTHAAKFAKEQAAEKRKAEKEKADAKKLQEEKEEAKLSKRKRGRPKKERAVSKTIEAREKAIDE